MLDQVGLVILELAELLRYIINHLCLLGLHLSHELRVLFVFADSCLDVVGDPKVSKCSSALFVGDDGFGKV